MKVLVACEESQAVCIEFRKLGHEAYSCDLLDCSGGHPEWHIKGDALENAYGGGYDMMIAFPPCTFLSFAGNGYFDVLKYGHKAIERWHNRADAMKFFYDLYNAPIEKIALENPLGFPGTVFRKQDQTIEPYYFGDSDKKRTLLWLKNLPKLEYHIADNLFANRTGVDKPKPIYRDKISGKARYKTDILSGWHPESAKLRSKTFPGIARAMAQQWGGNIQQLKSA